MSRFFSLFFFIAVLMISPVMAQEDADAVLAEQDQVTAEQEKYPLKEPEQSSEADYEERLKLSRRMHEIWPIRPKVEAALDMISERIPQQERLKFKAGMRKAIKFDALEEASVDAMADIFTVKELRAMIGFYGSKEGRSVSHKTSDYEKALQPVMTRMVDKALLDAKLGTE